MRYMLIVLTACLLAGCKEDVIGTVLKVDQVIIKSDQNNLTEYDVITVQTDSGEEEQYYRVATGFEWKIGSRYIFKFADSKVNGCPRINHLHETTAQILDEDEKVAEVEFTEIPLEETEAEKEEEEEEAISHIDKLDLKCEELNDRFQCLRLALQQLYNHQAIEIEKLKLQVKALQEQNEQAHYRH